MHNDKRDCQKRKLSASRDRRGIKVTATASPGSLIHTALNSIAANEWDDIFIQAVNTSGSAVKLIIEWGGARIPDDLIEITIPAEDEGRKFIPNPNKVPDNFNPGRPQ